MTQIINVPPEMVVVPVLIKVPLSFESLSKTNVPAVTVVAPVPPDLSVVIVKVPFPLLVIVKFPVI